MVCRDLRCIRLQEVGPMQIHADRVSGTTFRWESRALTITWSGHLAHAWSGPQLQNKRDSLHRSKTSHSSNHDVLKLLLIVQRLQILGNLSMELILRTPNLSITIQLWCSDHKLIEACFGCFYLKLMNERYTCILYKNYVSKDIYIEMGNAIIWAVSGER